MTAIRQYRGGDREPVIDVWRRSSRVAHAFLPESFFDREEAAIRQTFLPLADTWVALSNGEVVGFISLVGNEIGGLFVDPDHQGQGFGRALTDHARALHGTLELEVFTANTAGREFYERYGFEQIGAAIDDATGQPTLRLRIEMSATT